MNLEQTVEENEKIIEQKEKLLDDMEKERQEMLVRKKEERKLLNAKRLDMSKAFQKMLHVTPLLPTYSPPGHTRQNVNANQEREMGQR